MAILYRYLRHYWRLAVAALALAAINQVFSLLDPLIFRHIIDSYATRYREYSSAKFLSGVSLLLGAAVGVAFVSRVAKNFQDYFVNVITQQVGANIYADGIRHSLELPYTLFEDQRSGETPGQIAEGANGRREVHLAGREHGVRDADRPGLRDGLRLASALVGGARLPGHGAAVGWVEFGTEPQDQGSPEAHCP